MDMEIKLSKLVGDSVTLKYQKKITIYGTLERLGPLMYNIYVRDSFNGLVSWASFSAEQVDDIVNNEILLK